MPVFSITIRKAELNDVLEDTDTLVEDLKRAKANSQVWISAREAIIKKLITSFD